MRFVTISEVWYCLFTCKDFSVWGVEGAVIERARVEWLMVQCPMFANSSRCSRLSSRLYDVTSICRTRQDATNDFIDYRFLFRHFISRCGRQRKEKSASHFQTRNLGLVLFAFIKQRILLFRIQKLGWIALIWLLTVINLLACVLACDCRNWAQ